MSQRNPIREVKKYVPPGLSAPPAEVQSIAPQAAVSRPRADMTAAEAQVMAKKIRSGFDQVRSLILEFHERKGWKSLGYRSWGECIQAEFEVSRVHVNRQLAAARTESDLAQCDELKPRGFNGPEGPISDPIPEKVLRPLTGLPPEEKRAAFSEAVATSADGKPTAKAVQAAADRRKPVQATARIKPTEPPEQLSLPAPEPEEFHMDWREQVSRAALQKIGVKLDLTDDETLDLNRLIKGGI